MSKLAASGVAMLPAAGDFVPLCSGWLVLGDDVGNQLTTLNVPTGANAGSAPLTAAPSELALDANTGWIYAAMGGATKLARLDTAHDTVTYTTLTSAPAGLAVGNNGLLFIGGSSIALVNGINDAVMSTFPVMQGVDISMLAYDRPGNNLIAGQRGISPASLYRFAFDPMAITLTPTQTLWDAGENGEGLTISPDGKHVAYPCGGGNLNGYAIDDFHSGDFTQIDGSWKTGAYPTAAAFSLDGAWLAATNGFNFDDLYVFSTANHALVSTFKVQPPNQCQWDPYSPTRIGFSRGGQLLYLMANCYNINAPVQAFMAWFKL